MNELDDPTRLRKYLLGTLNDEAVQGRIEERLMVDEEFTARIAAAEDELIEEFLDGEMSSEESDKFNRFFLAPPERKRQLRLTHDLRRLAASQTNISPHPTRSQFDRIFSTGWLRFAMAAAVLVLAIFGVWRFAIYESDADKGLDQLRAAYRDRRPVESRISALDSYAPYSVTRGDDSSVTDAAALDRANRYLTDATSDSAEAAPHHALAMYYLAAGDLDRAEREMNIALKAAPDDAQVLNDAGAMHLEFAAKADEENDDAKQMIALSDGLKHLDIAISIDPKLLDARFNRGLALQALRYTEQAKEAWRQYLELDPNSKWTEEARRNLEKLERETPKERSAEELETDFLAAFRAGDENEASSLLSGNRELIRDKYLPTRLAMKFLAAPEERRDELLNALAYAGEIEMKLTGDPFAKEIARFYKTSSTGKWRDLKIAHEDLREGYRLCLALNYQDALSKFQNSQKAFDAGGDIFNAKIAGYGVGYALANVQRFGEAHQQLGTVESWAARRSYTWLSVTALHWVAACLVAAKQLTDARRAYERAISIAERINDGYAKQRNLSLLAQLDSICGQEQAALKNLFAAVKDSDRPETSLRQRLRNLFLLLPILFRARLYNAAKPAAMEVIHSADQQKEEMWSAQGRALAAIAAAHTGDTELARQLLAESREKAAAIKAPETRDRVGAFASLRSADFERSLGSFEAAERFYTDALRYYEDDRTRVTLLREEAHQGMLLNYVASGRTNSLEEQIQRTIDLTEEYRSKIVDEDQSIGFFDLNSNIYEIAAELQFDEGNLERAYNYAESSSSRTLLNMIQRRTTLEQDAADKLVYPAGKNGPLDLNGIRRALPAGVRVVQYSVFESKTVAWLISRDSFEAINIPVDSHDLSEKVLRFAKSVSRPAPAADVEAKQLAQELHRLLIGPFLSRLDANEELCIVPNKFLFDIPFAALIDPEGDPLIARFRLIHAPSANVFIASTMSAAARNYDREESLLAVGNPKFDQIRFPDFDYLSDSEDEVERVASLYRPSTPLLREKATKEGFLKSLPDADVIHVAAHYVAMPGTPMSSFLLMAAVGDDPAHSELSNLELTRVSIPRARLMVLAACRSGVESYYRSEGMAGMSRTVLGAQVPLVVASQWNIDSAATSDLMVRFHELRRKQHLSTTAALRQAQLELFNDPSGKFSSPYYWAAFAVNGGHASY